MSGTIHLPELALTPDAALTNHRRLYSKTDGWYEQDDAGLESRVTAWDMIGSVSLSSSAATIEFDSIPQIYRHLKVFIKGRSSAALATDTTYVRINDDAGANYDYHNIYTNNATPSANSSLAINSGMLCITLPGTTGTANSAGAGEWTLFNYRDTTYWKQSVLTTVKFDTTLTNAYTGTYSANWRNISAVTKLTIRLDTGPNFLAGTQAELVGIY